MKVIRVNKKDNLKNKGHHQPKNQRGVSGNILNDIKLSNLTLHKLDWLEWLTIVLSIWFVVYPQYFYMLLLTILLIIPIFGIMLNGLDKPSLASLVDIKLDSKKQIEYDVADFINVAAWAILIRILWDYKFYNFYSWIVPGIIGSVFTLGILFSTHRLITANYQNKIWIYVSIIFNIILYSFAGVYAINCAFDNSTPENYSTTVVDKLITHSKGRRGRITTNYILTIEPWGRYESQQTVHTTNDYYDSVSKGEEINITLNKGLLGIPFINRNDNLLYKKVFK